MDFLLIWVNLAVFFSIAQAICKSDLEATTACKTKLAVAYPVGYEDCKDKPAWSTEYGEIKFGQSRVLSNKYHYYSITEYFKKSNKNWTTLEKKIVELFRPKRTDLKFKTNCAGIERQSLSAGVILGKFQQLEILLEDKVSELTPLIDFGHYSSPLIEESFGMNYQAMYLSKIIQYNDRVLQAKQDATLAKLERFIHVRIESATNESSMADCVSQNSTFLDKFSRFKKAFLSLEKQDRNLIITVFSVIIILGIIIAGVIVALSIVCFLKTYKTGNENEQAEYRSIPMHSRRRKCKVSRKRGHSIE